MNNNLSNMMALDIYLSSLNKGFREAVSAKIKSNVIITPLLSWDIFSQAVHKKSLHTTALRDLQIIKNFAVKYDWQNDIEAMFKSEIYEALIVTDISQQILWVNEGFSSMTGYSKQEALRKTPRFLQGEETDQEIRKRISKKLIGNSPFKEVIINHKKDGTAYTCEVKIFPLNARGKKTHFIAFERQVG